ncbi:Mov34/MPN/PAD-1 family protein [uncultured Aeromicrobium sp.]|uniref:Mov34/MPN/PAD-1 family protein n=1 Tax=uncultured Aeromicrobium sp. TaxID=337820 RepID=UPI0025CCE922|nr:Mov34/MPN/PAD-1 family protein [uncultured Aeromicrobium sp.]
MSGATIRVAEDSLSSAERMAHKSSPHESGGILIGWWEGNSIAVVVELLPVADHAAGRSHYERRHSLAQGALDRYLMDRDDSRLGYVGEWHSHPAPQPPSRVDRSELTAIVRQSRKQVALVVLAIDEGRAITAHGLIGHPRWPRRTAIDTAVVERMSP